MPQLGSEVKNRTAPPSSGTFTTTDTAFLAGLTDQGVANTAYTIQSMSDFETAFGPRSATNQTLYDSADAALREGLTRAICSRAVGPAPVNGSVTLFDEEAKETLKVSAKGPGVYSTGYIIQVETKGSEFKLTALNAKNEALESHVFATRAAAAAYKAYTTISVALAGASSKNPANQEISTPNEVKAEAPSAGGALAKSTKYFWKVTAINAIGETLASSEVTEKTASGTELTIEVKWKAVTGATKYKIYRATTTEKEVLYAETTETKYKDAGGGTEEVGHNPPTTNTTGLQTLTGGTDNRSALTTETLNQAAYEAALAGFNGLGSGQVAVPGSLEIKTVEAVAFNAAHNNRAAVVDLGTGTEAELEAKLNSLAAITNAEFVAPFIGNLTAPGVTPGTTRTIPASAVACALAARGDATGSPNVAPCGLNYPLVYCTATDTDLSESSRNKLFQLGGNTFHFQYGVLALYGWQTVVPVSVSEIYDQFNHVRTRMAIDAAATLIGANYQFGNIDGKGTVFSAVALDLSKYLTELWRAGAIYGETANEAFRIDVGPTVNTPQSIAEQKIKALIEVRLSPYASFVLIELVSIPTQQALAA